MLVLLQGQKQQIHTKLHKYPSLRSKIKGENIKKLYIKSIFTYQTSVPHNEAEQQNYTWLCPRDIK